MTEKLIMRLYLERKGDEVALKGRDNFGQDFLIGKIGPWYSFMLTVPVKQLIDWLMDQVELFEK
jgi:hypothetical protein